MVLPALFIGANVLLTDVQELHLYYQGSAEDEARTWQSLGESQAAAP